MTNIQLNDKIIQISILASLKDNSIDMSKRIGIKMHEHNHYMEFLYSKELISFCILNDVDYYEKSK